MNLLSVVKEALSPLAELAGEFIVDKDKRIEFQTRIYMAINDLSRALLDAQSKIITAEAQGESWLQRNWRPMTMLTFVGLIVARWLGFVAPGVTEAVELELMTLVQIGLGGYVVGRSVEKTAPHLKGLFQKEDK
jgi:hypothetical protein